MGPNTQTEEGEMPVAERRASVVWEGDLLKGHGRVRVGSGAIPEQTVTFRARTETPDGQTSPEELIAAAHAICYAMAFSHALAQNGTPPERLEVEAVCVLDRVEGALRITTMRLQAQGRVPGLEPSRLADLARQAEQRCPVSNALRGNVAIELSATLV